MTYSYNMNISYIQEHDVHAFLFLDNTASIVTSKSGFNLQEEPVFYLRILISDNGVPSLTGTSTLTIYVCDCDGNDDNQACDNKGFIKSLAFKTQVAIASLIGMMLIFGK